MLKKVSRMHPDVAVNAVRQSAMQAVHLVRCLTLFAQSAALLHRYPSNPRKTVLYIVTLASRLTVHKLNGIT